MISIEDISHGYKSDDGTMRVLYCNACATIASGELFALIGRNGVGKSTLLKSIAGLHSPLSGQIVVDGKCVNRISASKAAALVSFVSTEMIRVPGLSVIDVVSMGRAPYTNWLGSLTDDDSMRVSESLVQVGMENFAQKSIASLSDGERQRVMIARALAQDTPVILLDEPTAFLDLPNKYEIVLLLRDLAHRQGKTVLFSSHDLAIAMRFADSVCVIDEGAFTVGKPSDPRVRGVVGAMFKGSPVSLEEILPL